MNYSAKSLYITLAAAAAFLLFQSCLHSPTLPDSAGKTEGLYHTVRKGQTLWRICRAYGVGIQKVIDTNTIKDPSQIQAGDRIFIPGAKKQVYIPPASKKKHRKKIQPLQNRIRRSGGAFAWPVRGKIIKQFGVRKGMKHDGINISAKAGTSICAARSGKVVFSSYLKGYGNTIIIQHSNSYATVYSHNSENIAKQGAWVKQGQKIATLGTSSSPYLHFQIRRWNQPRNPLAYLPE